MEFPEPSNDYFEKLIASIKKHGYHLTGVSGDDGIPTFLYSIGLWKTQSHPEFLVLGLHRDMAAQVGKRACDRVVSGHRYNHGDIDNSLSNGFACQILEIPKVLTSRWMLSDNWLYGEQNYPAFQIVFQDEEKNWPWDDEASIQFLRNQPMLARRFR